MLDVWERFNEIKGFRDALDEPLEIFEDETGIDFEDDVATWIGPDVSAAVIDLDLNDESVDAAATIGVRDSDAAADFLDEWLDYMEDEEGADFDRDSYGDFDVWEDEHHDQIYALSGDLLVLATTRDALEDVLDRVAGDKDRTLADSGDFQEARAALPSRRFSSIFIDLAESTDALMSWLLPFQTVPSDIVPDFCGGRLFETPRWFAASAGWVDRGLVLDFVTPVSASGWPDAPELTDVAGMLPDDTLSFMSVSFDPVLDHWREALEECKLADVMPDYEDWVTDVNNLMMVDLGLARQPGLDRDSTLADVLDVGLSAADEWIGLNLESDLLDHLGGQFILSLAEFDFRSVIGSPGDNPVEAVTMLSYRDGSAEDLGDTVNHLLREVEFDQVFYPVDVGATRDARIFDLDMLTGDTAYSPGYVLHDGYITFGTTKGALETVVARQKGDGDSLLSDVEFQRAVGHLSESRQFLLYTSLHRIIEGIDRDDMGLTRDQYRTLRSLGAVAISSSSGDDYSRFNLVLTLFPED